MKTFSVFIIFTCSPFLVNAQSGNMHSMGGTPGISLNDSKLKGPIKEVIEFTYYGKRNAISIDTTKVAEKTIMKFDPKGSETEELRYNRGGKLFSKCSYNYSNSKAIVVKKFIQDTVFIGKYIFTYNDNNQVIQLDIFPDKSNISGFRTLYKYNGKGNKEEESTFDGPKIILRKIIYHYNDTNQRILTSYYDHNGKMTGEISFTYDTFGNSTESMNFDMDGMVKVSQLTKRFKLDKYGNWQITTTEETSNSFRNELSETIIKRTIIYY